MNQMPRVIVNKDSYDKDCADLSCYNVFLDGKVIWPPCKAEKEGEK